MPETKATAADRGYVLVVDDEEDVRDTLCDVIQMGGCTAIAASNGREALAIASRRRPCLILLDLLMPVMSGEEMLAELRRLPELAAVPVIISTSAPDRAPPGVPVVPKPISIQAIWTLMRKTCSCARRQD